MKKILGNFQAVRQMEGDNGPVKNQFIIDTDKGYVFQSYQTVIAAKVGGKVILDKHWDSSMTTSKYRNRFLGETREETRKNIKLGRYVVTDLN